MANFQHKNLAGGRWQTFTFAQQMGNIGSEVERAINWKQKGNAEQMQKALDRGLELFDLTLSDRRLKYPQLKEVARARELVCDFLIGDNEYKSDDKFLNKYFLDFTVLARS
ncbi:MAG: hypothetical protein M1383_04370 [Patescibacteria group bacterium]|nr:hypothetical protein [Patescibacteria group bacterium]